MKKAFLILIILGLSLLVGCGGEVNNQITTEFEVKFIDYNGNDLKTEIVKYGEGATAPTTIPDITINERKLTFDKWDKSFSFINRDLVVRALYNEGIITFTYKFYDQDDKIVLEGSTIKNGQITPPNIREEIYIDGKKHIFDSWDKDYNNIEADIEIKPVYKMVTEVPQAEYFKVIYLDYKGYLYNQFTVLSGNSLPAVNDLDNFSTQSEVYTFAGWENAPEVVTSDLVLKPIFTSEAKSFTVKFYDKSNTIISEQKIKYGQSAVLPEYNESHFIGWDINTSYITYDLEVKPILRTDKAYYKVEFIADDYVIKTEIVEEGKSATPPTPLTKEGYTFSSWNGSFTNITSNKEITAIYNINKYLYRVYDDKGDIVKQASLEYLSVIKEEDPVIKPGYTFIGWDCNNDNYPDSLPKFLTGNLDLKPIYMENLDTEYKVEHYYQNVTGDGYTVFDDDTKIYNGRTNGYAVATPNITTGFKYNKNHVNQIKGGDIKADGSLVLKLYYDREQYTVVFIDGEDEHEQLVRYLADAIAPELVKEGYTLSWDIDFTKIISDKAVNSIWTINQYKIIYNTDFGVKPVDITYNYADKVTLPVLQFDNYSFKGWFTDASFSTQFTDDTMPAENLTLYAKWIVYNLNLTNNQSKKAIRAEGAILASDFEATAVDTDGDTYDIVTKIILGEQKAGASIVIDLIAEGKYGVKKTIRVEGVIVYGTPELSFDDTITSLNETDELTVELLKIVAKDTQSNVISDIDIKVNGDFVAGQIITLTITATDIAGNKNSLTTEAIKVYGKPTIIGEDISVKDTDTINSNSFAAKAKDSFDKALNVVVSKVTHSVKFYRTLNGQLHDYQTVDHYSQATRPTITPFSGSSYDAFSGWFYSEDGKEILFDFSTPIEKDYILYAKYINYSSYYSYMLAYGNTKNYNFNYTSGTENRMTFYFVSQVNGSHSLNVKANSGNPLYLSLNIDIYNNSNNALIASSTQIHPDENLTFSVSANQMYKVVVKTKYYNTGTWGYNLLLSSPILTIGGKVSSLKQYALKATDDFGNTNTIYQDAKVYSKPIIEVANSFDFKVEDEINLDTVSATAKDTFGENIDSSKMTFEKISGEQIAGATLQYKITATDIVGNVSEKIITCKIYGKPQITISNKRDIKTTDTISSSLFTASAKDSFNKYLSVKTELISGVQEGGEIVSVKFTATDHLGQSTETIINDVKVYSEADLYLTFSNIDSNGLIITSAKINGNAQEFSPIGMGSFGAEGITFKIEAADGTPLTDGRTTDIVIVIIDAANNRKKSAVIKNITVTY